MTLVKDISPTGIKAMRERISAEVSLARMFSQQAVHKRQWAFEAGLAGKNELASKWMGESMRYAIHRDDHMDAARRCKWELENV